MLPNSLLPPWLLPAPECKDRFLAIRTIKDLASFLDIVPRRLTYVAVATDSTRWYTTFSIPKRTGGDRIIQAPRSSMAILQNRLKRALDCSYTPRDCVHGFVASRSILSNARRHSSRPAVLSLDLCDFFPSITSRRIYGLFSAQPFSFPTPVASILTKLTTHRGALPQGASTSPVLSNIICSRMDGALKRLSAINKCTYTRYADDLTFSTTKADFKAPIAVSGFSRLPQDIQLGAELVSIIESNGFSVNGRKTRLQRADSHQEVTGLTVNAFPNVERRFVRQVRGMLHAWKQFGIDAAESTYSSMYDKNTRSPHYPKVHFQEVVRGRIAFIKMIKGSTSSVYRRLWSRYCDLAPEMAGKGTIVTMPAIKGERDFFVCHASEDKDLVVRPLIRELTILGATCWVDEAEIKIGDLLTRKIDDGLKCSTYVVVVLSRAFISKKWPQYELNAALAEEISTGVLRVLPVLVGDEGDKAAIRKEFKLVAGKLYANWSETAPVVAKKLMDRL